jgi:hypothetical protein
MDRGAQNTEINVMGNWSQPARSTRSWPPEMDMKQTTRAMPAQVSPSRDDGSKAARLLALSMGLLFGLIFVLQAISW